MLNPYAFSLAIKSSLERQSNAFDRSVRSVPNICLLSIADFHFSYNRKCWALNPFLNPRWYFNKKDSKIFRHLFKHKILINFRNIWQNTERSAIFFSVFWVFLWAGVIIANFDFDGETDGSMHIEADKNIFRQNICIIFN